MIKDSVPVFPLNIPLLPGCYLPLQIFEKRYLDMVSDCMRHNTGFVVALLHQGAENQEVILPNQQTPLLDVPFFTVGTFAEIVDFGQRDNGLLSITIKGKQRENLSAIQQQDSGLWMASTQYRPDSGKPDGIDEDVLETLLQRMLVQADSIGSLIKAETLSSELVMNYLIMLLPLPADLKHTLTDMDDLQERWLKLRGVISTLLTAENAGIQ
ncbi:MAG: LON peptidase substrate-binding domain-containing protein [Pseudomonadales bacterium]|nr:LON peptidase substrate-binding domain-containing protein [Pseudomonadales bacterium]